MWIRSQRKNALVNINFMRVINDGNFCLICGDVSIHCLKYIKEQVDDALDDLEEYIK